MGLRETLRTTKKVLDENSIDFALIGGFALAGHGIHRATRDIDILIDGSNKDLAISKLEKAGFELRHQSKEVLQFEGIGYLDILLANRPMSQKMLSSAILLPQFSVQLVRIEDLIGLKMQAYSNDPKREYQDKADIQSLIEKEKNLNWDQIKKYADLFDEWNTIESLRKNR